ncbi:hypothetical protein [Paracidovorax anthurii]|uniref:Uncharacterized protein n=1 Tax=Paracidovorax anthurii TaxID=78229 RepID=A0A328YR77_9BURK|nr:hypothetical protein [Paracidovorax anthurii]RAR75894.1 hypothetical protein AX018_10608 [Paracidovorax anthurii]
MTRIDPTARLGALIKTQMETMGRAQAAPPPPRPPTMAPAREKPATAKSREQMLARLSGIGADDPDRRRRAFRIFLETTLSETFGPQLQDDPGFGDLVDRVMEQMQEDPSLSQACDAAADVLLTQPRQN